MGVEGNKKADEAFKEEAERAGTRKYPEQFVSLTHVSRTIKKVERA